MDKYVLILLTKQYLHLGSLLGTPICMTLSLDSVTDPTIIKQTALLSAKTIIISSNLLLDL